MRAWSAVIVVDNDIEDKCQRLVDWITLRVAKGLAPEIRKLKHLVAMLQQDVQALVEDKRSSVEKIEELGSRFPDSCLDEDTVVVLGAIGVISIEDYIRIQNELEDRQKLRDKLEVCFSEKFKEIIAELERLMKDKLYPRSAKSDA